MAVIIGGIFAVLLIIGIAANLFRMFRRKFPETLDRRPTEIATIIQDEAKRDAALAGAGLMLLISTIYCIFKYFAAETVNQQITSLLLWIGNGIFWGSLIISNAVLASRTSTVFRSEQLTPPASLQERREPRL